MRPRYRLPLDDPAFDELLHQTGDDCLEPLRADSAPESGELGGVVGLLPFLYVAGYPQQGVVPQSPVEFSVAGYLSEPLGHQCFEDSQRAYRWSAWAFLVICFVDCFFDVV